MAKTILSYHALYARFVKDLLVKYPEAICVRDTSKKIKSAKIYLPDPNGKMEVIPLKLGVVRRMRVRELITYDRWRNILEHQCMNGRNHVIEGNSLILGMQMGNIRMLMVERNHNRRRVNFKATNEQPKVMRDGKLKPETVIYYTEDYYPLIKHFRANQIPGERSYKFYPCSGNGAGRGFKKAVTMALTINPDLSLNYQTKKSYIK